MVYGFKSIIMAPAVMSDNITHTRPRLDYSNRVGPQPGICGGLCNPSFWDGGIWGWLEDESPPWRLLVTLWRPHLAQDQFCTTRGLRVGHGGGVVVKKDPCQTKFQFCQVPRMDGIKLQLLCGVRIELAVGSLPYPDRSGFPIVWMRQAVWIPNSLSGREAKSL